MPAARLNVDAKDCTAVVLDDVIEDGDGNRTRRRITVTLAQRPICWCPMGRRPRQAAEPALPWQDSECVRGAPRR
jgi:hypothetical protein